MVRWHSDLRDKYLRWSRLFFVALAFWNARCFLRASRLLVVSIQGFVVLDLVLLWGACLLMMSSTVSLKSSQWVLTDVKSLAMKSCTKLDTSWRNNVMSALSPEYISLRTGLLLSGCINKSIRTASWSPTPGITLQRCTREGLFVKNGSSILSPRVGVFTSCCTPQSPGMLVYSTPPHIGVETGGEG